MGESRASFLFRSLVRVSLFLALSACSLRAWAAETSAESDGGASVARREVWLAEGTKCPSREELSALLKPLLPGVSIRAEPVESSETVFTSKSVHRVAWDDRGLSFDGELVHARSGDSCRKLAEDWAVAVALLVDDSRESVPIPAEKQKVGVSKIRDVPSREVDRRKPTVLLGWTGGGALSLLPDGEARAFGALDAALFFGNWGLVLNLGATSAGAVTLERTSVPEARLARAVLQESWASLSILVQQSSGRVRLFGSLGPHLALERVSGSGLDVPTETSALHFGVDATMGFRVPIGTRWALGVPLSWTVFPQESALLARNTTTGAEVRLGTLPRLVPRVGLGLFALF